MFMLMLLFVRSMDVEKVRQIASSPAEINRKRAKFKPLERIPLLGRRDIGDKSLGSASKLAPKMDKLAIWIFLVSLVRLLVIICCQIEIGYIFLRFARANKPFLVVGALLSFEFGFKFVLKSRR